MGGIILREASELAKTQKFAEAQKLLENFIARINASEFSHKTCLEKLKIDIEKSLKLCKPKDYENQGRAYMEERERGHVQRRGCGGNRTDWNSN